MTDTSPRDLIKSLSDALHNAIRVIQREDGTQHIDTARPVLAEARAYLAQPEPEGPTDEEILELSHEHEVSYTMCDGHVIYSKQEGCDMRDDVLSFARAVLARWGK